MERGKRKELEKMLADLDSTFAHDCPASATGVTCMAHSGMKATLKYLLSENIAQWDVIRSIDRRLWGIVLGVGATFAVVLLQLLTKGIHH